MRVLVYGEPYDWAMPKNVVDGCRELGHDAQLFDYTRWLPSSRFALANRIESRLLFSVIAKRINVELLGKIRNDQYDVLIVLKGIHLFPETLRAAKKHIRHIVNWNPDDFFNPLNSNAYLRAAFPLYDCIYTPRRHLLEEYRDRGAKRIEVLNWYYVPRYQHPVHVSSDEAQQYGSDIAFVGTWSRTRESVLLRLHDFNLRVWGGYWDRASKDFRKKIECHSPIFGREMCKVICSSKININMLTSENRDTTNYRNFEIPACAGFQLSERSFDLMQLFKEDDEIALFSAPGELRSQCEFYLANESDREKVRAQGHRRLIEGHHAMKDRVATILSTL